MYNITYGRIEEEEKLQQTRKEACHKALDKVNMYIFYFVGIICYFQTREMRDAQRQLYARLRYWHVCMCVLISVSWLVDHM